MHSELDKSRTEITFPHLSILAWRTHARQNITWLVIHSASLGAAGLCLLSAGCGDWFGGGRRGDLNESPMHAVCGLH